MTRPSLGSANSASMASLHVAPRGLLHIYALLSIANKPVRGYDLMKEIEYRTEGAWRPGLGALYPVLRKLAKQRFIQPHRTARAATSQVMYEITPVGLRNLEDAKKAMGSSGERMGMMRSLFVDPVEAEGPVRYALNPFGSRRAVARVIVESERSALTNEDRLFVLRQYKLELERELSWVAQSIGRLQEVSRPERAAAKRSH